MSKKSDNKESSLFYIESKIEDLSYDTGFVSLRERYLVTHITKPKQILRDLDNDVATQTILEVARDLPPNHNLLPRLFKTLCEVDSIRASDLAVQLCGQPELPDRIVWYTIHKLINQGYLPESPGKYLRGKDVHAQRLLTCIHQIISELRLNPDADVLSYILERKDRSKFKIKTINIIKTLKSFFGRKHQENQEEKEEKKEVDAEIIETIKFL